MKILPVICCLCFCFNALAQEFNNSTEEDSSKLFQTLRISLYLENGVHPGLKFGTSYLLKEKEKSREHLFKFKQTKHGNKVKKIQYLADVNLGMYNHPNNHFGTFIGIGFTRFRVKPRKMRTYGLSFEFNYLRRFYNLKTYQLSEDGTIERVKGAGTNSVVFVIAPSFGKIYGLKKGKKLWHFFIKPSFLIQRYNHAFVPNAALELGATLKLK